MPTRQVTIGSAIGLHARPASLFVQAATNTGVSVSIAKDGAEGGDATSLLAVMALGARNGDLVTLSAEGDGADDALGALTDLLRQDLDAL